MKPSTWLLIIGLLVIGLMLFRAVQLMDPPPGHPLPGQKTTVKITNT